MNAYPAQSEIPPLAILVAEDIGIHQLVAKRLLRKEGHEVTVVENGQQAVEAIQRGAFDVVLMDIEMPVLDGLEATRRIRRLPIASQRHIPIVALTANENPEECLAAGMNAYLTKPIQMSLLARILHRLCARASV